MSYLVRVVRRERARRGRLRRCAPRHLRARRAAQRGGGGDRGGAVRIGAEESAREGPWGESVEIKVVVVANVALEITCRLGRVGLLGWGKHSLHQVKLEAKSRKRFLVRTSTCLSLTHSHPHLSDWFEYDVVGARVLSAVHVVAHVACG